MRHGLVHHGFPLNMKLSMANRSSQRWRNAGFVLALSATCAVSVPVFAQTPPDGAAIYQQYCAVCHGERGDGQTRARRGLNPPPRDFTTPLARAELTRERMLTAVRHGRPGTAMMAFDARLGEAEISAVVDHIRASYMLQEEVPVDAAMVSEAAGERLYVSNCAVCHGDDGNGAMWTKTSLNPPPREFTLASPDELTRERMINSVTHGRPGTAMMSFAQRLSPAEIEVVVDYVRGNFLGKAPQPSIPGGMPGHPPVPAQPPVPIAAADMTLPFPNNLVGDASKGGEFYMNNCATCHGEKGDGNGPRAAFNRPPPRNFLGEEARRTLNRPNLLRAIAIGKPGTVMPAWSKVLSDQEMANVAEFVFQRFVAPDAGSRPVAAEDAPLSTAPEPASDEKKKARS